MIDCETNDLEAAASFWSQALGYRATKLAGPNEENYMHLETGGDDVHVDLQQVEHPSRVHLDIETDNLEAEVSRLERLGAKRIERIKAWWVMEAPTGHRFCVVSPQRGDFVNQANRWES